MKDNVNTSTSRGGKGFFSAFIGNQKFSSNLRKVQNQYLKLGIRFAYGYSNVPFLRG